MEIKDGMDISLCSINKATNELEWSGANNPLLYVQKDEMKEIEGDKQPIGKHENSKPFITHKLKLYKGNTIYMFSDGYSDQFGGEKGKKFMYKHFKEKLMKLSNLSMHGQKERLNKTFEEWKGGLEQVDDMMVVGIRL